MFAKHGELFMLLASRQLLCHFFGWKRATVLYRVLLPRQFSLSQRSSSGVLRLRARSWRGHAKWGGDAWLEDFSLRHVNMAHKLLDTSFSLRSSFFGSSPFLLPVFTVCLSLSSKVLPVKFKHKQKTQPTEVLQRF